MPLLQSRPRHHRLIAHLIRHRRLGAGLGGIAMLGMVGAFALSGTTPEESIRPQTVLEALETNTTPLSEEEPRGYLREEQILRSDTLYSLASRLGISEARALDFLHQNRDVQAISRQLRPGKTVTATTSGNGALQSLYFPLNDPDRALLVERRGDHFFAHEQALHLEPQLSLKSGNIQNSLYAATDDAGIPDAIANQLAEIFGAEIDFYRGLRKGDRFSVVYETLTYRGQPIRSGRILGAEFVNDKRVLSAYWFQTAGGKGAYYNAEGKSLRKAFLRSPLEFSRVTSGFSTARFHPILQTWRAHKGIDYGAPTGTRVRSVADGTVISIGKQSGYGNIIVVKHQGNYSTAYGHLNGFGRGLHAGARVSQGDTIGYVGQTGMATGPHLHYEFRVGDRQIDPLTLNLPSSIPLDAPDLARFRVAAAPLHQQLELAKQTIVAAAD